jgi:Plavaka transposase
MTNLAVTAGFPQVDIHELLCSDLLYQTIKKTFKNHLIMWVSDYLELVHGPTYTAAMMADIDRQWDIHPHFSFNSTSYDYNDSIAAAPPFPGQWCFPQGKGFKQWTGNDLKALMKVCYGTVIFLFVFLANYVTGLFASNQLTCARSDGALPCSISWILLLGSMQHYYQINPWINEHFPWSILHRVCYF